MWYAFVIGYLSQQYVSRCRFIDGTPWRKIALLDPVWLTKLFSLTKPANQYGERHLMPRYIIPEMLGCCLRGGRIANWHPVYSSPPKRWTRSLSHSTTPPRPKQAELLLEERNTSSVGSMSPLIRFPFSSVLRYAWMILNSAVSAKDGVVANRKSLTATGKGRHYCCEVHQLHPRFTFQWDSSCQQGSHFDYTASQISNR